MTGIHVPNFPIAALRPHLVASPHGMRQDPYYWLRDDTRTDPQVLAHLAAETAYAEAMLGPAGALIEAVYQEILGRLQQDDSSVPVRYRGYWYTLRYLTAHEYPLVVRRADRPAGEPPGEEAVLLDCNAMAAGHAFFQLGSYEVSPDNRLLAYTEDVVGRRQYRLRVKDLHNGEVLADVIDNVEASIAWADDNRSLLYVEKDPVTLLGRRVRCHLLGTEAATDALLYEEPDESFDLVVMRSKSEEYLLLGAESTTASEWRYARADDPSLSFRVAVPREADHEYQIEPLEMRAGGEFLIRSNWNAQNFRIAAAPVEQLAQRGSWREVVAQDPDVFIEGFDIFRDFLAVSERRDGLMKIRLQRWGGAPFHLSADDPAYAMQLAVNPEIDARRLRYVYSSLTTPATTYEYDLDSGARTLLKREPVLGDFDPARYQSELIWAPARDGARIPVSIVYRKDTPRDGTAPLYLYAYGSYGLCTDPTFSSARLSLLDRGFVYAIAHVRGGQELGRRWYDTGRLRHKWNTFHDFIDARDHLVTKRYAHAQRVFAAGGSAGGLLMGVIANVAPDKFAGLIAHVPFVDIVTTMLDESIPLTTLEYEEWGDPHERDAYEYMLSYSPYDNVRAQAYPPLLVTTGLWDSQVQYYEPAKWVAKLRAVKTDGNPLLLHVNLEAGHGGKSGRFEHLREVAREYGFLIMLATDGLGAWDLGLAPAAHSGSDPSPASRAPRPFFGVP